MPRADEWESLDADADDCVGEFCERFSNCWFFMRRDAARYADLVVVNHALFFMDLAMGGGLLPPYDFAILDEAHQCERYATAAMTATLSQPLLARMMRKLHGAYHLPGHHDAEITEGIRRLTSILARLPDERVLLREDEELDGSLDELHDSLLRLEDWVHANWESGLRRTTRKRSRARTPSRAGLARDHRAANDRAADSPQPAVDRHRTRHDRVGRARRIGIALRDQRSAVRGRRLLARDALQAHAKRRLDERDAWQKGRRLRSCVRNWASTKRKSWSRPRRSITPSRRGSTLRRRASIRRAAILRS